MEDGKISVIMGIYNCADTLPAAIESILDQTYSDWELIMCDDCSTDHTYQVAKEYRDRYPDRIKLTRNEKNSFLACSLNQCLKLATGKYVARMDGDDRSAPERFERQVEYLQEHPDIQLVGTAVQHFNEKEYTSLMLAPEHPDKYTMRNSSPFKHATILTYKYVYDQLGGYCVSDRTRRSQDRELFFRFFAKGFRGDNINEPLYLGLDDLSAVKRRTFKVRWNSFLITRDGYRLLGFPRRWLIKPFFKTVIKTLIPYGIIYRFRSRKAVRG